MNNLLTFQTAESKSLKTRFKIGLGNVVSGLMPNRVEALRQSPTSYPTNVADIWIVDAGTDRFGPWVLVRTSKSGLASLAMSTPTAA